MLSIADLAKPLPVVLTLAEQDLHARMAKLRGHGLLTDARATLDLDKAIALFEWPEGGIAAAGAQIIALARPEPGAADGVIHLRFAWDDPTIPPALRTASERLRALAARPGFEELGLTGDIRLHRQRAWAFVALACALTDASGAVAIDIGEGRTALVAIGPLQSMRPA